MLTLWCIARSPLIMGGDLRKLDDFTLSRCSRMTRFCPSTNTAAELVNCFRNEGPGCMVSRVAAPGRRLYRCVQFKRCRRATVPIKLAQLGIGEQPHSVRDLWRACRLIHGTEANSRRGILAHGAGLYWLSPESN